MRRFGFAVWLLPLAVSVNVAAQEPVKPASAPAVQPAPKLSLGQRKYQSIFPVNTPKEVLEPLKAEEGVWDADVELYVGDPAKQPIRKTGVQTNRLVSKGNAMLNEFHYSDGSYEGTGLWGWDAYNNRYTGTWIDSDTHLVRHDIGYYNPETRTLRWESDTIQPNGITTRMRMTEQFRDDRRTFQIDVMDAKTGDYKKLIFMTFTRRKA